MIYVLVAIVFILVIGLLLFVSLWLILSGLDDLFGRWFR